VRDNSGEMVICAKPAAAEEEEGSGMALRPAKSNNITNRKAKAQEKRKKKTRQKGKEEARRQGGEGRVEGWRRNHNVGEGGTRNRDLIGVSWAWV
jgi:hypothetical protein